MEKCYSVGIHRYCYRAGEPAEIIGIRYQWVKDEHRIVYKIRFADGKTDTFPVSEIGKFWKIISFRDIVNGNIPKVTE